MLIDEVLIILKAGNGGNGAGTLRRNAQTAKGGPDGGNGGNGGSIYVQGSSNIVDLREFQFKKVVKAQDGISGKKNNLFGKNGDDLLVLLPIGTKIIDSKSNNTIAEIENGSEKICIAKGGKGGRGNNEFKTATNQAPTYAEKGEAGEEKKVKLILQMIADIGLVGLPNSGKSTLLSLLTRATPKIGNYPFTTLEPNLGTIAGTILADIPGVIKGASKGKGLGLKFLKHIEKTNMLVYCIDSTEDDPYTTYTLLKDEFNAYDKALLEKPEVIVLTKSDLVTKEALEKKKLLFGATQVTAVCAYDDVSIENLKNIVLRHKNT